MLIFSFALPEVRPLILILIKSRYNWVLNALFSKLCDKTYFTPPLQNRKDKVNMGQRI